MQVLWLERTNLISLYMYQSSRISTDFDGIAGNVGYDAAVFARTQTPESQGCLIFHPGPDERSLGTEERYSLTLHVRTHEGTVGIVVFKEGIIRYRQIRLPSAIRP